MNRSLHTSFIIIAFISLSFQSILFAGRLELKFFSSETGYSIIPDKLLVTDANNPANSISIQNNSGNSYIAELAGFRKLANKFYHQ